MTSIRALVVSENLDMSTGAGTLGNKVHQSDENSIPSPISLDTPGSFVLWGKKKKKLSKSHRFMTRFRRYATAACDSAESTTSRVVIYNKHSHASFSTKVLGIVLGAVQILCVLQEQVHYVEFEKLKTERAAIVVHIHCGAPVFSGKSPAHQNGKMATFSNAARALQVSEAY